MALPKKSDKNQYQTRSFNFKNVTFENRAENDLPVIKGLAAVFGKLSEDLGGFKERIKKGAFAKSIKEDVRALINHNADKILGRTKSQTLKLKEIDEGLAVEIDPPKTSYARDIIVSVKRGDVSQMSFGFQAIKDKWITEDGKQIRELLEARLFDVSIVTFPAYPQTVVQARQKKPLNENQKKLLALRYEQLKIKRCHSEERSRQLGRSRAITFRHQNYR